MKVFILIFSFALALVSCKTKKIKVDPEPKIHVYSDKGTPSIYSLEVIERAGSCEGFQLINEEGEALDFSPYLDEVISSCPTYAEVISDQLFFHDSDKNVLMLCDIVSEQMYTVQAIERAEDEFSYLERSPSGVHLLFATINQQNFPNPGTLYHLMRNDRYDFKLIAKHELALNFSCGGRCVAQDFEINDDGTIRYMRNINYDDRPGEWETIPFTD